MRSWQAPFGAAAATTTTASDASHYIYTAEDAGRRYDLYENTITETRKRLVSHHLLGCSQFSDEETLFAQVMETLEVSPGVCVFAGAATTTATSATEAAIVIQTAMRLCGLPDHLSRRFPGAHPISLQREHLETLRRHRYAVSKKWEGERVMLLVLESSLFVLERNFGVRSGIGRLGRPSHHEARRYNASRLRSPRLWQTSI